MAITNGYATLAELKAVLRIPSADSGDTAELELAVESASRAIDTATNRRFWQDGTAVKRYYLAEPRFANTITTADISTSTGLVVKLDEDADGVYETTLTIADDFYLSPLNAAANGQPWTRIVKASGSWPTTVPAVEVEAKFGWAAVPTAVKQATLLQAARFYQRRNAPFGIAGSPEIGSELRLLARLDPDVAVLLSGYRKHWVAA